MTLVSLNYLLFVAVTAFIFYILPNKARWVWLLAISLGFFIMASGIETLPYLLFGVIVSFLAGWLIENKCDTDRKRKIVLAISIILLAGELLILKDSSFLVSAAKRFGKLFGITIAGQTYSLIAPLGISYYTLSVIGYVTDVYRTAVPAQKNILKHALFTCYFPQMISGPFVRYGDMKEEFFSEHKFDGKNVKYGMERMLWGYVKKMIIADRLQIPINTIFANPNSYPGAYEIVGVFLFAFQIYCDFSGCMDIVIGTSQIFGVKLPENFKQPWFSSSLSEFWRRWHITLGSWSKDYLFYPMLKSGPMQKLGRRCRKRFGKRAGKLVPVIISLLFIWIIIGLWHGGTLKWVFVAGLMPWTFLVLSQVLEPLTGKIKAITKMKTDCFSYKLFGRTRVFIVMCLIWLVMNMPKTGLTKSLQLLFSTISVYNPWVLLDGSLLQLGITFPDYCVAFIGLLSVLAVSRICERGENPCEVLDAQNIVFRWFVLTFAVLAVLIFGIYGPSYNPADFIYAKF